MIIINADDWGRSRIETDAALSCFRAGRITSVSAMVFMEDSERAAIIARDEGIDVGLHLNLSETFTGTCRDQMLQLFHRRIVKFISSSKYSVIFYNPMLRKEFRSVYQAQIDEFIHLYGKRPSHIDGHHHKHLCVNLLLDNIIPPGEKLRRNFTFRYGEKGFLNRAYRNLTDQWLTYRYRSTDAFYALSQYLQTDYPMQFYAETAAETIEIMVHPAKEMEYACLMGDDHFDLLCRRGVGTYSML